MTARGLALALGLLLAGCDGGPLDIAVDGGPPPGCVERCPATLAYASWEVSSPLAFSNVFSSPWSHPFHLPSECLEYDTTTDGRIPFGLRVSVCRLVSHPVPF